MSTHIESISFDLFGHADIEKYMITRQGETKIGEKICTFDSKSFKSAKYVILGVEESIGPKANLGRGGAEFGYNAFLSRFLNMQATQFFAAEKVAILGRVKVSEVTGEMHESVAELDEFIKARLHKYVKKGQIPILIGGGHNNALPLISYLSETYENRVNVVNLDAHADYRLLEGRHSGNAFSYAYSLGYLNHYHVFGLHYQYNSQQIFDDLKRDGHTYTLHEAYITQERNYAQDFEQFMKESNVNIPIGVELDLDTIARMPSSAFSPLGISINEALQYVREMAKHKKVGYLHLTEGAPVSDDEGALVGKSLAYLVTDFIRSHGNHKKL